MDQQDAIVMFGCAACALALAAMAFGGWL